MCKEYSRDLMHKTINKGMSKSISQVWILTYTGREFHPFNPCIEDIDIVDIAHALSNECRFTGHCKPNYNVAQHSLILSYIVPQEHALAALLHDAAEAYTRDISSPQKEHLFIIDDGGNKLSLKDVESSILNLVFIKYGVSYPDHATIKSYEYMLLAAEVRDLMPHPTHWFLPMPAMEARVEPLDHAKSEELFISRFCELTQR